MTTSSPTITQPIAASPILMTRTLVPYAPSGMAVATTITGQALMYRFTQAERVAIRMAMQEPANATIAQIQACFTLQDNVAQLWYVEFVDLAAPVIQALITALQNAGYMAAGRAATIYGTSPTQQEQVYV